MMDDKTYPHGFIANYLELLKALVFRQTMAFLLAHNNNEEYTMSLLTINPQNRLWKTFWIYGVLGSHILWGILAILLWGADVTSKIVIYPLILIILLYTAWICRGIFTAAADAQNELHGIIAQNLTVAWAINSVLVSLFLAASVW